MGSICEYRNTNKSINEAIALVVPWSYITCLLSIQLKRRILVFVLNNQCSIIYVRVYLFNKYCMVLGNDLISLFRKSPINCCDFGCIVYEY